MEALTINNLAPYLPFGLKMQWHDERIGLLLQLALEETDNAYFSDGFSMTLTTEPDFNKDSWMPAGNHQAKPICFSLDNLTKPITINGETFVPIEKLFQMAYYSVYDSFFEGEFDEDQLSKDHMCLKCEEPNVAGGFWKYGFSVELPNWFRFSVNGDFLTIPNFTMYEKLFEWKFAINLPEGSWIDVNSLEENPYK